MELSMCLVGGVNRRAGAASALLGAAERMAGKWQQNWVLLHVYGDNFPGLRLYHRNGCAVFRTPASQYKAYW